MKPFADYDKIEVYKPAERLPAGGYIIKILSAKEVQNKDGSPAIEIQFDINEGDYKGFYTQQYRNSQLEDKKYKGVSRIFIPRDDGSQKDTWTKQSFKRNILAVEDSNAGFHWAWNETELAGKVVGALFRDKEFEPGKFFTELLTFCSVEDILTENFKIPAPKLKKKEAAAVSAPFESPFDNTSEEELPY